MKNHVPVEGQSGLYRDTNTQAIINKDQNAYNSYIARKKAMNDKNEELNRMKEDLDGMKNEMGDIKSLLLSLNQKLNN